MRNVESRPAAAFVLAYCPCVITKEKDHDEAGSPRKKDREPNEAKRTTGIQKEEEEARRRRREKRKTPSGERSETRSGGSRGKKEDGQEGREENIKDIARGKNVMQASASGLAEQ